MYIYIYMLATSVDFYRTYISFYPRRKCSLKRYIYTYILTTFDYSCCADLLYGENSWIGVILQNPMSLFWLSWNICFLYRNNYILFRYIVENKLRVSSLLSIRKDVCIPDVSSKEFILILIKLKISVARLSAL